LATKKVPTKAAAKGATPAKASKASMKAPAKPAAKAPVKSIHKGALAKTGTPKKAVKPAAKPVAKPAAKVAAKPTAKPVAAKTVAPPAKPAAKAAVVIAPAAKPAPTKAAPAKGPPAKSAVEVAVKPIGKAAGKVGGKAAAAKDAAAAKPGPLETPIVPKKGPIDLNVHKSVAAAAAAVAQARGPDNSEFMLINGRRVRAISKKSIILPKKSKTAAAAVIVPPNEAEIAEIRTKLTKKELDEYRALLLDKRRATMRLLNGMEDAALRSPDGNLSNMPNHMADMGSDVYDQDFTLSMAEGERKILEEIDAALLLIENKTYGVCQLSGKPISKARLEAKPWAKYTVEAERIMETSGSR
jgi:RNA polymerase-binding transcription factor DksA